MNVFQKFLFLYPPFFFNAEGSAPAKKVNFTATEIGILADNSHAWLQKLKQSNLDFWAFVVL